MIVKVVVINIVVARHSLNLALIEIHMFQEEISNNVNFELVQK